MATEEFPDAIGAEAAREGFGDVLGRVTHAKTRVVISRHRKPVAAIVPIEDLRRLEAMEDARDVALIRHRLATMKKTYTLEEVRRDLNKPVKRRGLGRRV
jgi:prevent-host-death family protein